jgi:hypothetical protein
MKLANRLYSKRKTTYPAWESVALSDLRCFEQVEDLRHVTALLFQTCTTVKAGIVNGLLRMNVTGSVVARRYPQRTNTGLLQPWLAAIPEKVCSFEDDLGEVCQPLLVEVVTSQADLTRAVCTQLHSFSNGLEADNLKCTRRGIIDFVMDLLECMQNSQGENGDTELFNLFDFEYVPVAGPDAQGPSKKRNTTWYKSRFLSQRENIVTRILDESPDNNNLAQAFSGKSFDQLMTNEHKKTHLSQNKFPTILLNVPITMANQLLQTSNRDSANMFVKQNGMGRLYLDRLLNQDKENFKVRRKHRGERENGLHGI